jgi:hypothetical protein
MHTKRIAPWLLTGLLALAALACDFLIPANTTPTVDVATQVAATLTALAPAETGLPATGAATEPAPATAPATSAETTAPVTPEPAPALKVAYIKDGNVHLWTEGSSAPLTTAGQAVSVQISSDGAVIAFTRQIDDLHAELWAVNADGSNERQLVSAAQLSEMDPGALAVVPFRFAWVPNTHVLAYNTRQVFEGPGLSIYNDLRQVDADSLAQSTLLAPGLGGEFYYSPDGSQIALVTPTTISLINADGSNRRDGILTYERVLTYSEFEFYAAPRWALDGSALRVGIPPPDQLSAPGPTTIYHIPVDGSPAAVLGTFVAAPLINYTIPFSPDLSRLAYLAEVGDGTTSVRAMHLANADASGDTVFHTMPLIEFADWAPDSTRFAFFQGESRELQTGQFGVPFSPAAGSLTGGYNLRWVDNNRYLLLRAAESATELLLGRLEGPPVVIDPALGASPAYDFDL